MLNLLYQRKFRRMMDGRMICLDEGIIVASHCVRCFRSSSLANASAVHHSAEPSAALPLWMKISGLWKRPFVAPVRIHPPLKFFTPHLLPASFFCPFPACCCLQIILQNICCAAA
jgi:hypothetical protein